MLPVTIRHATPADAGLIADLSRQTFHEAFAADNSAEDMALFLNGQFTRQALVQEVGAAGNSFLLAYRGNDVAGYARMRAAVNPPGLGNVPAFEIARIYAVQHCIGKGVGSALMQECIQIAKESGCQAIWLGVWEKNERAINFYKRWGFERFGEHVFLLGNDHQTDWLMKKHL